MPNAFVHIELTTDDLKRAKQFYQSVFSWKLEDMPGMGYTMIDVGKGTGGGMQNKPTPEAPTAWLPYVEVADVDETLAKASQAGAQIVLQRMDIGEMGAIGIFVDPTGAMLGVWAAPKKAPRASQRALKKRPAKKKAPVKKRTTKKNFAKRR